MEGQHTRPHEIDQALRKDFYADAELATKQRLAVAHIEAEVALEQRYVGRDGARALYSTDAVQAIHQALFGRLPAGDLLTDEGEPIVPGQLRQREVQVGQHVATAFASLPQFLEWWAEYYGHVRRGEAALMACVCAHPHDAARIGLHRWTVVALAGLCPQHRALLRALGRCRQPAPGVIWMAAAT